MRLCGLCYEGKSCNHENCPNDISERVFNAEQLELFPELVKQWEEDAKWYTVLRLRMESDL